VATRAVGALPVFALTVVPAAGGLLLSDRLGRVIAYALATAVGATVLGYYLSFIWSLPTGATIVATAALSLIPGTIRRAVAG
jgi:zinc transport system permease protein